MKQVLAIDQGTTATKAYKLAVDGRFTFCSSIEHPQIYPHPGWVEHDPETLIKSVFDSIEAAGQFDAIGLDNQGETVIAWERRIGRPVYNAIVWQDQRTTDFIEALKAEGAEQITLLRAGLPLDPYFSASKLRWIIKNVPEAVKLLRDGKLMLGTSETFFIYRLTGEYATDVTTASRTSLMNLETCQWDPDLCDLFEIPMEILPEIRPTTANFGIFKHNGHKIPLCASVVDQQAALMGHSCYAQGQIKATFGTGVFTLANVGDTIQKDPSSGILPTVAWQFVDQKSIYAVDAGVYTAGSAVNWLKSIGLFSEFSEIDKFEKRSAFLRGLAFVPALSGLACPFWDRSAAGLWLGLSLETTREDLSQAVLEGIAFRTAQLLDALEPMIGTKSRLSVDGGLINNSYFCQFLADVIQSEIVVPASPDITTYGTAKFALIGSGLVKNTSELPPGERPKAVITPRADFSHLKVRYNEAVLRSKKWR